MAAPEESVVHGSKARPEDLPAVDKLLRQDATQALLQEHGHTLVATQARALLDSLRPQAVAGNLPLAAVAPAALTAAQTSA